MWVSCKNGCARRLSSNRGKTCKKWEHWGSLMISIHEKRNITKKDYTNNSDKSPSNQRQCHKEMGSCLSTGFDQRIVRTGPWISKALADLNVADLTFKVIISCTSGSVSTAAIFRFFVGSPVISPCTCASAMCTWSQVCQNSESSTWSSFLKRWMKLVMKPSEW